MIKPLLFLLLICNAYSSVLEELSNNWSLIRDKSPCPRHRGDLDFQQQLSETGQYSCQESLSISVSESELDRLNVEIEHMENWLWIKAAIEEQIHLMENNSRRMYQVLSAFRNHRQDNDLPLEIESLNNSLGQIFSKITSQRNLANRIRELRNQIAEGCTITWRRIFGQDSQNCNLGELNREVEELQRLYDQLEDEITFIRDLTPILNTEAYRDYFEDFREGRRSLTCTDGSSNCLRSHTHPEIFEAAIDETQDIIRERTRSFNDILTRERNLARTVNSPLRTVSSEPSSYIDRLNNQDTRTYSEFLGELYQEESLLADLLLTAHPEQSYPDLYRARCNLERFHIRDLANLHLAHHGRNMLIAGAGFGLGLLAPGVIKFAVYAAEITTTIGGNDFQFVQNQVRMCENVRTGHISTNESFAGANYEQCIQDIRRNLTMRDGGVLLFYEAYR